MSKKISHLLFIGKGANSGIC